MSSNRKWDFNVSGIQNLYVSLSCARQTRGVRRLQVCLLEGMWTGYVRGHTCWWCCGLKNMATAHYFQLICQQNAIRSNQILAGQKNCSFQLDLEALYVTYSKLACKLSEHTEMRTNDTTIMYILLSSQIIVKYVKSMILYLSTCLYI